MESVYCEIKYSGAAEAFLVAAVGGTLAIVVFVPFPDAARVLLFAAVVGLASHARAKLRAIQAIRLDIDRRLELLQSDGRWRGAVVREGSFVAPWLTIIRWRPDGGWYDRSLVLLPGMVGAESLRAVRVILRWS
jgi:hypothetical protein